MPKLSQPVVGASLNGGSGDVAGAGVVAVEHRRQPAIPLARPAHNLHMQNQTFGEISSPFLFNVLMFGLAQNNG